MRALVYRIEDLERSTEASKEEDTLVIIDTMPPAHMTEVGRLDRS